MDVRKLHCKKLHDIPERSPLLILQTMLLILQTMLLILQTMLLILQTMLLILQTTLLILQTMLSPPSISLSIFVAACRSSSRPSRVRR
jgi:hypothetical protein